MVGRDKRPPEGDLGAFWAGEPQQLAGRFTRPGESSGSVEGRDRERRDTIHTPPSREDLRALICLNPASGVAAESLPSAAPSFGRLMHVETLRVLLLLKQLLLLHNAPIDPKECK